MGRRGKVALYLALAAAVLVAIAPAQQRITARKDASWYRERMSYLPQSDRITPFLLGYQSTAAAYLWIRTMLYFGDNYEAGRDFHWLVTMVDMVTRLNPRFYPAYEFAGLILPSLGENPDAARVILQRGLTHLGAGQHRIAFYLGWLYYDKYKDYKLAGDYLALAAANPRAPAYLTGLAASMYRDAGHRDMSVDFLLRIRGSTENPAVQRVVERKLKSLLDERGVRAIGQDAQRSEQTNE